MAAGKCDHGEAGSAANFTKMSIVPTYLFLLLMAIMAR